MGARSDDVWATGHAVAVGADGRRIVVADTADNRALLRGFDR